MKMFITLRTNWDDILYVFFIPTLIGIGLLILAHYLVAKIPYPVSNWRQYFFEFDKSGQDFYALVKQNIENMEMPDVKFSKKIYGQGGIFSPMREYLRVRRNEYIIDICAAPFGKGFFVSYWLGQDDVGLFARIPVIRTIFGIDPRKKTYYQLDTERMFLDSFHSCVVSAINEVSNKKGLREVSELSRARPVNYVHSEQTPQ